MENESSDESHDELDAEQEHEDDNPELEAEEDQNNNDLIEDEVSARGEERKTPRSTPKPNDSWTPLPRKETIAATVFDIVPTM